MRVSVVGAGGIGGALGAYLARAGHDVTLVYRRAEEAAAVRENGLRVTGENEFVAEVDTVVWPGKIPPSDLLVAAVKTYQTEEALRVAEGVPVGVALSVQNGLQKEAALGAALGRERVLGSVVMITAAKGGRGHVHNADLDLSFVGEAFGEAGGAVSGRARDVADAFTEAGVPTKAVENYRSIEWTKTCQWIATSSLSVVSGFRYPGIFSTPWLSPLFVEVVRECSAVAGADGAGIVEVPSLFVHHLDGKPEEEARAWLHRTGAEMAESPMRDYRASMLLDLEGGSPLEFEDVAGYVLDKAREHDVETPALDTAARLVRALAASRGATA